MDFGDWTAFRPDVSGERIIKSAFMPQDWKSEGVLRIPAQITPGPHTMHAQVTCTHLDGREYEVSVPIRLTVRSLRDAVLSSDDPGPSPYILGNPVQDPAMFFGRRGVLERIYEQVARPGQANLVLLEGNRRTGKSTILAQLKRDPDHRLDGWVVADCSFQEGKGDAERPGLPTREVFFLIARNVALALHEAGFSAPIPGSEPFGEGRFRMYATRAIGRFFDDVGDRVADAFRDLLDLWLDGMGATRLLLLLDEFDKLDEGIQSGVTSPQVPDNLRALFQQEARVSAVLAVFPRITRLRQGYWDALFGLGAKVELGPLEPDEALDLVQAPVRGRLTYQGEAARYLVGQCGRQPYLIQVLAEKVFANRSAEGRSDVPVSVVEDAARTMASDSEHFHGLWQVAGPDRRRLLLALVHRLGEGRVPVTLGVLEDALEAEGIRLPEGEQLGRDHLDALRELGLVRMEAPGDASAVYVPTVPLMGRWIALHTDPDDLRARALAELTA